MSKFFEITLNYARKNYLYNYEFFKGILTFNVPGFKASLGPFLASSILHRYLRTKIGHDGQHEAYNLRERYEILFFYVKYCTFQNLFMSEKRRNCMKTYIFVIIFFCFEVMNK